ncbi:hypothetical protein BGZ72_003429, partial [Mortierella alpina]
MQARHPNLYRHCICRCSAQEDVHPDIWKDALARIDGWGRATTAKYNRAQEERQATWIYPTSSHNIEGLSSIAGVRALLLGEDVPDCHPDLIWSVADLYRGITPIGLIQGWGSLFATPKSIAKSVIHKFVGYLAKQAIELIWKPCCKATIEWERQMGITPAQKRAAYRGPRGDWSAGYGF